MKTLKRAVGVAYVGYFAVATLAFIANAAIGPITLPLALARGLFWPLWLWTDVLRGVTGGW